jgi:tetratricopeptide (TPR) repeat protein
LRDPILYNAALYVSLFHDLDESFGKVQHLDSGSQDLYFPGVGEGGGTRITFCKTVAEVEEVRIDTVTLRVPRRIVRLLEQNFNSDEFGFLVALFPQKYAKVRLNFSYSHPLMRERLFLPLAVFAPKGIPFGERNDICSDEDGNWERLKVAVYASNASSSTLPSDTQSLESYQKLQTDGRKKSGLVLTSLPAELEGGRPVVLLRATMSVKREECLWVPLSSAFLGLQRAASCVESGNVPAARRAFEGLMKRKRCSSVIARCAAFYASQRMRDEAVDLFREAVQVNPWNPLVFVLMGECAATHDERRAIRAFSKALELDAYDSSALVGLAKLLPRYDEQVEQLLQRALVLHSANEQASVRLESLQQGSAAILERADAMKIAGRQERKEAAEHISSYLLFLNSERKILFPGGELF